MTRRQLTIKSHSAGRAAAAAASNNPTSSCATVAAGPAGRWRPLAVMSEMKVSQEDARTRGGAWREVGAVVSRRRGTLVERAVPSRRAQLPCGGRSLLR